MDLDLEELKMRWYVNGDDDDDDDDESAGYRILSHVTGELAFKVMPKLKNIKIEIQPMGSPWSDYQAGNFKTLDSYYNFLDINFNY